MSSPPPRTIKGIVEWPEQAKATRTIEREQTILAPARGSGAEHVDAFAERFLRAPLFSHVVRERLRHAVHGRVPPGRAGRRLPMAGVRVAPRVRRVRRGRARRGARGADVRRRWPTSRADAADADRDLPDLDPRGSRVHRPDRRASERSRRTRRRRAAQRVRPARDRRGGADGDRERLRDAIWRSSSSGSSRATTATRIGTGSVGHGGDHLLPVFVSSSLTVPVVDGERAARDLAVDRARRPEPRERRADGPAELRPGGRRGRQRYWPGVRSFAPAAARSRPPARRARAAARGPRPRARPRGPRTGGTAPGRPPWPRGRRARPASRRPTRAAWARASRWRGSAGLPRSCARRSRARARRGGRPSARSSAASSAVSLRDRGFRAFGATPWRSSFVAW